MKTAPTTMELCQELNIEFSPVYSVAPVKVNKEKQFFLCKSLDGKKRFYNPITKKWVVKLRFAKGKAIGKSIGKSIGKFRNMRIIDQFHISKIKTFAQDNSLFYSNCEKLNATLLTALSYTTYSKITQTLSQSICKDDEVLDRTERYLSKIIDAKGGRYVYSNASDVKHSLGVNHAQIMAYLLDNKFIEQTPELAEWVDSEGLVQQSYYNKRLYRIGATSKALKIASISQPKVIKYEKTIHSIVKQYLTTLDRDYWKICDKSSQISINLSKSDYLSESDTHYTDWITDRITISNTKGHSDRTKYINFLQKYTTDEQRREFYHTEVELPEWELIDIWNNQTETERILDMTVREKFGHRVYNVFTNTRAWIRKFTNIELFEVDVKSSQVQMMGFLIRLLGVDNGFTDSARYNLDRNDPNGCYNLIASSNGITRQQAKPLLYSALYGTNCSRSFNKSVDAVGVDAAVKLREFKNLSYADYCDFCIDVFDDLELAEFMCGTQPRRYVSYKNVSMFGQRLEMWIMKSLVGKLPSKTNLALVHDGVYTDNPELVSDHMEDILNETLDRLTKLEEI